MEYYMYNIHCFDYGYIPFLQFLLLKYAFEMNIKNMEQLSMPLAMLS